MTTPSPPSPSHPQPPQTPPYAAAPGAAANAYQAGGPAGPAYPAAGYPATGHPAAGYPTPPARPAASGNTPALVSVILAGVLLLWDIIRSVLIQVLVRTGGWEVYQAFSVIGAVLTFALAIAALVFGLIGILRGTGRKALAGIGVGVGGYILISAAFSLVTGLFASF